MFVIVSNVYADENEQSAKDWSYEETNIRTRDFTWENSPSARFIQHINDEIERKLIKKQYLREKYTYEPFSPNKRQHRKMTKTDD
jgi:hypothetical protein